MQVERKELLNRLLAVEAGATPRETVRQSHCVVLRRGRFYTFCTEIACSVVSTLPVTMEGVVELKPLLSLFKQMEEDYLDVEQSSTSLVVKAKGKRARLKMQEEVLLPVDDVERPDKDAWAVVAADFSTGIDITHRCSVKNGDFAKQCVYIGPEWMQACDGIRMVRYDAESFVTKPVLVRGVSIKQMTQLGFTRAAETKEWLHFRNAMGLRMSVRKFELESYPPLEEFLNLRGRRIIFPKSLESAARAAGLFAGEDGCVEVRVEGEDLVIEGRNPVGEYGERKKVKYGGPPMRFSVPPKLIAEVIGVGNEAEVTTATIRVNGGKYVFVASMEVKE